MTKFKNLIAVIIVAILLTACGGGNEPSTTLKADMTDFHFTPGNFIVPAGQEINFVGANSGAVVHEFIIMKLGTSVGDKFDAEDSVNILWQIQVQPGSRVTGTFTIPDPGEYQVVCGVSGHLAAGMVAKLVVAAP